jgi:hypothetical protein
MGQEERHRRPARKISGVAGELLAAAELLRHGFTVSWPLADVDGYDLLSDDGSGNIKRLQVKTCTKPSRGGVYRILFSKGGAKKVKHTKADCDFLIAVIMYPEMFAFYVIPIEELGSSHHTFWPKGPDPDHPRRGESCLLEPYLGQWELLA